VTTTIDHTPEEMMTIAAARRLRSDQVVFVGIGLPSLAAILAQRTHAPDLRIIYESGAIGARPARLPLSIGDGEIAEGADVVVSVPEIFNYWLQGGRIEVGFLGAAQIDRLATINTTVIGDYDAPAVRLPGAGGAPEIAASAQEVVIILKQSTRAFVDRLDFTTTPGHIDGGAVRSALGLRGAGPTLVITDLGLLEPDPDSRELVLTSIHPGVGVEEVRARTGWHLRVRSPLPVTVPPTRGELRALRDLSRGCWAGRRPGARCTGRWS
jgi:glutaconate CoA-transferase subunit B